MNSRPTIAPWLSQAASALSPPAGTLTPKIGSAAHETRDVPREAVVQGARPPGLTDSGGAGTLARRVLVASLRLGVQVPASSRSSSE